MLEVQVSKILFTEMIIGLSTQSYVILFESWSIENRNGYTMIRRFARIKGMQS